VALAVIGLCVPIEACQAQFGSFIGGRPYSPGLNIWTPYYPSYNPYSYYPYSYYSPYQYTYTFPSYTSYYYLPPTVSYVMPVGVRQANYTPVGERPYQTEMAASIEVLVPAGAEVTFDGKKTRQTGQTRRFVTPALAGGTLYTYEVRATWAEPSGSQVIGIRSVDVAAGQNVVVDFRDAEAQASATDKAGK